MVAAMVVLPVAGVGAAPGGLDTGFGTAGRIGLPSIGAEQVVDANGKLVTFALSTAPDFTTIVTIRRLLPGGMPDATFSGDGQMTFNAGPTVGTSRIGVDHNDRILVVVGAYSLYRITAAGAIDTTFSGDGRVDFGHADVWPTVTGIGIQPDNTIVVGVADTVFFPDFSQLPQIYRISNTGSPLASIDVLPAWNDFSQNAELEVDGLGRIYVLVPDDGRLTLRRYTTTLVPDTSFSGDGVLAIGRPGGAGDNANWGGALHVTDGGVALVSGGLGTRIGAPAVETELGSIVARVTPTGALDPTFSGDGIAALSSPTGLIAPQTIGTTRSGGAAIVAARTASGASVSTSVIWEYAPSGAPDPIFSGDGRQERTASPGASTVGAGGSRVFIVEAKPVGPGFDLVALQLHADLVAPVSTMLQPAARWTLSTSVPVAWSASDTGSGVANYDVARRAGAWNGSLPLGSTIWLAATTAKSKSIAGVTGSTYCWKVRARDQATNTGAYSSERCTAVPLRADQLAYTGNWAKSSLAAAYAGLYERTTSIGAKVTRTGIVARRIALIATRCATCGSVKVYWNGVLKKSVSLSASTTQHRVAIELLVFATTTTGTLTLQVATAGRLVGIEGLGISKSGG
jgi:hypothetical protein